MAKPGLPCPKPNLLPNPEKEAAFSANNPVLPTVN
jgi:hypothetical protein